MANHSYHLLNCISATSFHAKINRNYSKHFFLIVLKVDFFFSQINTKRQNTYCIIKLITLNLNLKHKEAQNTNNLISYNFDNDTIIEKKIRDN